MKATEAYVDALESRIKDLEVENKKLQSTITEMKECFAEIVK